jgi:hypothetical protein
MATPPRPAHPNAPRPPQRQPSPEPEPQAPEPEPQAPESDTHHPSLEPEAAVSLFRNGHRIAKQGDPQDQWISMSRHADGTAVAQTPVTDAMIDEIRAGEYYLVDDQGISGGFATTAPPVFTPAPPTLEPPAVIDVPYVSAEGALANCTMGNWTNEPTSYAYAWQRNGAPISGATSADYTMTASDSGKPIGCIVTATNAAGSTAAPLSNTVVAP